MIGNALRSGLLPEDSRFQKAAGLFERCLKVAETREKNRGTLGFEVQQLIPERQKLSENKLVGIGVRNQPLVAQDDPDFMPLGWPQLISERPDVGRSESAGCECLVNPTVERQVKEVAPEAVQVSVGRWMRKEDKILVRLRRAQPEFGRGEDRKEKVALRPPGPVVDHNRFSTLRLPGPTNDAAQSPQGNESNSRLHPTGETGEV